MTDRSRIRRLFGRTIRKASAGTKVRLEWLEDRCVLDATVFGTAAADQIRVRPGEQAGQLVVSSDNGTFPTVTLPSVTGALILAPGGGDDTIVIEPLGGRFAGDVRVTDPDGVTLKNVSLPGNLLVNAVRIAAADGATIQSVGDISLIAADTYSGSFPLDNPLFRDRQAAAGITIGSAALTARNITLSSSASTDKLAKTDVSQDARAVALADVNGDGKPDLITAATDAGTGGGLGGPLLLFLNTGRVDPFDGAIPQTITRGGGMTSLAVGDVTGDGKPDLIVGSTANPDLQGTSRYSRLFVNTGGTAVPFQDAPNWRFDVGTGTDYTTSVALADVNSDGKLDLLLGNEVGLPGVQVGFSFPTASRLIFNQGGANPFAGEGQTVGALTANTQAVTFADLDGDGRLDLIAANAPYVEGIGPIVEPFLSTSRVFLNAGGGAPFEGFGLAFGGDGALPVTSVATGDLNRDGRPDIVLGVDGQPSQVLLSAPGRPAYLAEPITIGGGDAVKGVVLVDVDGDGSLDIVTAVAGVSRAYLNLGDGSQYTRYDLVSDGSISNGVAGLAATDLNGDGLPDLAMVGKDAPPLVFVNDGAPRPYTEGTARIVSLDPTLTKRIVASALASTSLFASAVESRADSSILVKRGASLTATAGNVVIDSNALAVARNSTLGMFVGFTYASVEPTATARLLPGARVSAKGAFQLTARTNSVLDVSVTTVAPMLVNIDIAYGKSRAQANAVVEAGATVTAGSATVAADALNSLSTSAGGYNLTFDNRVVSGGVGIAVTDYSSTAVSAVDGTLTTTTGDVRVAANATNAKNSTDASASVLSVTRTLIGTGKTFDGISTSLNPGVLASGTGAVSSGLYLGGLALGLKFGGRADVAVAAGIAWVTSELTATARVGGRLTTPGNLTVSGRTEDNVKVAATGSAGNADRLSLGGGLAVSNLNNTASATVAPGADMAVGRQLHVVSDAVVPNPLGAGLPGDFRFVPPPDNTGVPTSNDADRVANGYQMGQATADGFKTYMLDTIVPIVTKILSGDPRALGTTFVKGTGSAQDGQAGGVGIGGGINVFRLNNTSTATIGKGARVNQRSPGAGVSLADQDVWVEADTTVITIQLGNQVSLINLPDGGAGASGAAAIGGQFEYVSYTNQARAYIDDGATVRAARDLKVTANTFNYLLTVIQAGAKGKSVGIGGTMSIHEIRNQTSAYAEDGAVLSAGRDIQVLAGNQLQVFNAGGGITQGSSVGFGVSAAVNLLHQNDTFAFLGDNNSTPLAGTVSAGRNVDVKANADTLVVGVAISGSSADGLSAELEKPFGPDGFSNFAEFEAAAVKYLDSLKPKGGIGASGDAVINGLASDTRAYIRGPGSVAAGRDLTISATDSGLFAAASGAVASGNSAAFAGSVAINTVRRNTRAFADGATRLTAGSLTVSAVSLETPVTVAVGVGKAQEDVAVAGSVGVTVVDSTTAAELATTGTVVTTRPSTLFDRAGVTVEAYHAAAAYSVAGVAAAALSGTAAVGLAVDVAVRKGTTTANLGGQVTSAGDVKVFATDSQTLFGVAAGLAAAVSDGAGAAGSVTVGSINQVAIASIARNARVDAASSVRVDADGRLYDLRIAGGVAGGKDAGIGGAATVNLVPDRTVRAVIDDFARVRASGANGLVLGDPQGILGNGIVGVAVDAATHDTLLLFAAAGAVSPGTAALAGTVTVNLMTNNVTEARLGAGVYVGSGDLASSEVSVLVNASHQTNAVTVAGSLAAARTAGVGAAVVIETIERNVRAYAGPSSTVSASRVVMVDAVAGLHLTSVAGALAGGRDAAVALSAVEQTLRTNTLASVGESARIDARLARVTADNTVVSAPLAGLVAGSLGIGTGASNVSVIQTDTTLARVSDNAQVTTTGPDATTVLYAPTGRRFADGGLIREPASGLAVVATAGETLSPVAIGAAGGRVGLAGSISLSVLDLITEAKIGQGANIRSALTLVAADDTSIAGAGGAVALGSKAGVGAGIDVQTVKKHTAATIDSSASRPTTVSSVGPGDVIVRALSTGVQVSTSAAAGVGLQVGLAGGASGLRVDNATLATIGPAAVVSSQGNVIVTAEDATDLTSVTGAVSAGKGAGIGAAAGVAVVTKNTQATVGAGASLTSLASGPATMVADGGFTSGAQEALGGTFDPRTAVTPGRGTIFLRGHQFTAGAGQAAVYRAGDADADLGLVDGQTYYVIVVGPDLIRLASTAELARHGVSDVALRPTSQTGKTSSLLPAGKGPIELGSAAQVSDRAAAILARRNLTPTHRAAHGVAVTAVNLDRVESYAAAAGGGSLAVQLAAAVDVVTSLAMASVGDAAVVTAANAGAVLVSAGNELFHLGASGAVGVGVVAVAPGIHIPVVNLTTIARIGDSARVTAARDVEVRANASEDLLSIAIGLAASVGASVGGSASVVSVTSRTAATTGAGSEVKAGGSVIVTANDATRGGVIDGAAAVGKLGGLGGAVGVTYVDKAVRAALGANSVTSADAVDGLTFLAVDPSRPLTGGSLPRRALKGVLVQANSSQDLFAVGAAGAGGKYGALAGAVTVGTVQATTTAEVESGARVNMTPAVPGRPVAVDQDVVVTAVDSTRIFGAAGALAGAGGALAGGVDVAIVNPYVQARVGPSVILAAARDVLVGALAQKDVQSAAVSVAGGAVGVAGAVSVVNVGSGLTDEARRSLRANDDGNTATTVGYLEESATGADVTGLLAGYRPDANGNEAEKRAAAAIDALGRDFRAAAPTGKAASAFNSGGGATTTLVSAGSAVIAGRAVTVAGRDRVAVAQTTGSLTVGLAAFGGAVSVATVADRVDVKMDGAIVADGDVTLVADYDSKVGGGSGAGQGKSNGVTVGLIGLGAQVSRIADNAATSVSLPGIVIRAGTLTVESTRDRTLDAQAQGVTVGGVVVGVAQAKVEAGGSNTVAISGQIGQGAVPIDGLVVNVRSLTLADASTKAVAAGVVSGAGSDAAAIQSSTTPDTVTLAGARITVANGISVAAASEQRSRAYAEGLNIGAATAGVSLASATAAPNVHLVLVGATLTAGGDVSLASFAQGQSVAEATASGGGVLVGAGATATHTARPSAMLSITSGSTGATRVTAGGRLNLSAKDGATANGAAYSPSYSFASVGKATATGVQVGSAGIHVGAGTHLIAGADLDVSASETRAVVNGFLTSSASVADGQGNAAASTFSKSSGVSVDVGDGAILSAGGRLSVNANTGGLTQVESSAAIGIFPRPAFPSTATSAIGSVAAVRLGNSTLSGRDVSLTARSAEEVTNVGNGSTSFFTGGDVLVQRDQVGVSATVSSGSGFRLNAATLGVAAHATAFPVKSQTNGNPRATIDSLSRYEDVALNGQINLSAAHGAGATYIRREDGSVDPASTLAATVTDAAITFGDITGFTPRATARFDAGGGSVGGAAVITLDGRRLGGVEIVNLDQARGRSIVLGKIDLTPMTVDPATAITYVGGAVNRYAVVTQIDLPSAAMVAVTNRADDGGIVLTREVINPAGGVSLTALGSLTSTDGGRVVAGDLGVVNLASQGRGDIVLAVELSHGRSALADGPAGPRAGVNATASGGSVALTVTGVQYLDAATVSPSTAFADVDVNAHASSGSVRLILNSQAQTSGGTRSPIDGAFNVTASASSPGGTGDLSISADATRVNTLIIGSLTAAGGVVSIGGFGQILDGTSGVPSVVARTLSVASRSLGLASNGLDTRVDTLVGQVETAAFVKNAGPLTVGDMNAGERLDIRATGAVTITGRVSAGGAGAGMVSLHAEESAGAGNDLTVLNTAVVSAGDMVSLLAGDDVRVQSGSSLGARSVRVQPGYMDSEPDINTYLTFLGRLSNPGTRLLLAGNNTSDVFLVAPQVTAEARARTVVVIMAGDGADEITVRRADVPTTILTGAGTDRVTIAADDGRSDLTNPVINDMVSITSPDLDRVTYIAAGFSGDTTGRLTATDLTGLGMGPAGRLSFSSTSEFILQLGSGSDRLTIDGSPTAAGLTVFAGDGHDRVFAARTNSPLTLYGQAGDDLLVGGGGGDLLDGGEGNDVLIGHGGSDALLGQGGGDLQIPGATAFDDNHAALDAILAEWTSTRTYARRVANLSGVGRGPRANGPNFLKVNGPDATVHDDGVNTFPVGDPGSDWIIAARNRRVRGLAIGASARSPGMWAFRRLSPAAARLASMPRR